MARKPKEEIEQLELDVLEDVAEEEVEEAEEEEEYDEYSTPAELFDDQGRELLFPGGPTLEKVEEWKSLHGDEIYLTEFESEVFLWRVLKRKEYKDTMKIPSADNYYKEERICDKVVLWPENYSFMNMAQGKAGIPTLIAELVMEKSGFQAKTGAVRI